MFLGIVETPKPDPDPKPEPSKRCHDKHGNPISTGPFNKPKDCHNFYQVGKNAESAINLKDLRGSLLMNEEWTNWAIA